MFNKIKNTIANRTAARELSRMDDRMLADIGITRGDIKNIARGKSDLL